MEMYASSAAVRDVWEKADKHMTKNYGESDLSLSRAGSYSRL